MATNSQILHRQVASLRVELKAWEHAFKSTHNRKASREDISNDASVREKYREYNRLQYAIDNPQGAKSVTPRKPKHLRQRAGKENLTPKKTWQKNAVSLEVVKEDEQLELEVEQTPAFVKCGLGPTPQKDGLVLGIFDFASSATPSKSDGAAAVPFISCTPSKPPSAGPDPASSSKRALSATPQSSSKRRMLDAFIGTPLSKRRKLDSEVSETPSTSKGRYGTPQFLRRSFPLAPVDEEGDEVPPAVAVVPKKRGLVRSLSQIIQNLRKTEEKRMDDEWDILDSLENPSPAKPRASASNNALPAKVLVEDSQLPEDEGVEMPLGPDQGEAGSSDEEDGKGEVVLGRDGKPRKAWKKKGLKRQTKRTNMRPVLHKAKKASDLETADDGEEVVQETQLPEDGDAEFVDGDGSDGDGAGDNLTKATKAKKAQPGAADVKEGEVDGKGKPKAKKKVAATANANFRALKIKNKNSKASGKGGGRKFGRR
ncbi:hypothetical protein LTR56_019204 [Elasticomyces elasticus]|nr:hypothetical protein LTR56_019204 [Elasticomyces elasticus]KAK3642694.1 hypothetical protein LTR22_015949 [Elasticomyces elasticus]KAK4905153.1 hypothetical protein LTR49_025501 [Elasticomyces elasticus]KAK5734467.1 hypothetical protein LTS12_026700 [Elasticomyces elasticus]